MNKKQLIVAWVIAGLVTLITIFPVKSYIRLEKWEHKVWVFDSDYWYYFGRGRVEIGETLFYFFPIILVGSLLIYTLRDKKE